MQELSTVAKAKVMLEQEVAALQDLDATKVSLQPACTLVLSA